MDSQFAVVSRNARMAYIMPGFKIPVRFARIAERYFEKSPNDYVLRAGIHFAFRREPDMPIEKFTSFCKAAYGLQVIGDERMKQLGTGIVHPHDERERTPFLAIDIYDAASRCPTEKLELLAKSISTVICHDRNLKFQAKPRPLLDELVSSLSAGATFLPGSILDYVFTYGGGSCQSTKGLFICALDGKMLIKTEATIGGKKIPIYIKGLVSHGDIIAYAPSANSLLYINKIDYGKVTFCTTELGSCSISSRQFSGPELQMAIMDAEKKNGAAVI